MQGDIGFRGSSPHYVVEFILQRLVVSPVNDKGTRRKLLVGNIEFLRCCADSDSLLKQNSHESGFSHGAAVYAPGIRRGSEFDFRCLVGLKPLFGLNTFFQGISIEAMCKNQRPCRDIVGRRVGKDRFGLQQGLQQGGMWLVGTDYNIVGINRHTCFASRHVVVRPDSAVSGTNPTVTDVVAVEQRTEFIDFVRIVCLANNIPFVLTLWLCG